MSLSVEEMEENPRTVDGVIYEEDDSDTDSEAMTHLAVVVGLLKSNAHLLDFLADPNLTKAITARERSVINRQLDRMYTAINEADEFIDENEEETE